MIYKQAMMPFNKQRLVVLRVTGTDTVETEVTDFWWTENTFPFARCELELKNAKALTSTDPRQVADKFRLLSHGAASVANQHLLQAAASEPNDVISGARGSSSPLDGYYLSPSRDLFVLFNVPTKYKRMYKSEVRDDNNKHLIPERVHQATRQLDRGGSDIFSTLETIMLPAKEVLRVMHDACSTTDESHMNGYAHFLHRVQA